MKKSVIILSLLFVAAIALMPFALSSCGMNGFHMTIGAVASACGSTQNFGHLTFMRGLLTFGLVASIVAAAVSFVGYLMFRLKNPSGDNNVFKVSWNALRQKFIGSIFKPFDALALAYASGVVQPKVYSVL